MKAKHFLLTLLSCIFLFSCSNTVSLKSGSIKLKLPGKSVARAAVNKDDISFKVTIVTSEFQIGPFDAKPGDEIKYDNIPGGECTVSVDAYLPSASSPAYSGSETVMVELGSVVEVKILLKRTIHDPAAVSKITTKIKDDCKIISNNPDWSNLLIMRSFNDGTSDLNYFPATDEYKVEFSSAITAKNFAGNVPVVLTAKDGSTRNINLNVYYSLMYGKDIADLIDPSYYEEYEGEKQEEITFGENEEDEELNSSENEENSSGASEVVSENTEEEIPPFLPIDFTYYDRLGQQTQMKVTPVFDTAKWYLVEGEKRTVLNESANFDATKYLFEMYMRGESEGKSLECEFTFKIESDNTSVNIDEWIVDKQYSEKDISITDDDIKNLFGGGEEEYITEVLFNFNLSGNTSVRWCAPKTAGDTVYSYSYLEDFKNEEYPEITFGKPECEGYKFVGWGEKQADDTIVQSTKVRTAEGDQNCYLDLVALQGEDFMTIVELYAMWEKVISFEFDYNYAIQTREIVEWQIPGTDNATVLQENTYTFSAPPGTVFLLYAPERTFYTFTNWLEFNTKDGRVTHVVQFDYQAVSPVSISIDSIKAGSIFYAGWQGSFSFNLNFNEGETITWACPKSFGFIEIEYDSNNEDCVIDNYNTGSQIDFDKPRKNGYRFIGWSTTNDPSNIEDINYNDRLADKYRLLGSEVLSGIVYYAMWEPE